MAAATHHALTEALNRPLDTIPASKQLSPAPRLELSLSSPFMEKLELPPNDCSAESGTGDSSSTAPVSHHSAAGHNDAHRARPTPLTMTIPPGDEAQPLFSSYPMCGDGQDNTAEPLERQSVAVRKSSLTSASRPVIPPPPSAVTQSPTRVTAIHMADRPDTAALSVSRRRSLSTLGLVKRAQDKSAQFGKPGSSRSKSHRRRSSLGSGEFDIARWREMGSTAQFDRNLPYGYGRSDLELKPTDASRLPTLPSAQLPLPLDTDAAFITLEKLKIARDEVPPRSSSLPFEANGVIPDNASIVSLSDPSLSSPSVTSKSLPSTKTSLSRSVRSGKEGTDSEAQVDDLAQALLDKRRMILLEIVETEVNYVHALRALVHIYLPQLAVLPQLSDRNHTIISRNSSSLLEFHTQFAANMIDILKGAGMGYECCQADILDRVTRQMAELFVREASSFALYNDYCAGSLPATTAVRDIADRVDYEVFEKRCQYISSATAQASLEQILANHTPQPCRARLRFKDILISPIQRVCRYPLLLASLLADVQRDPPPSDVVSSVDAALAVMRNAAESADDARQRREAELKTAAVIERLESHNGLTPQLLKQLGTCRLIGALDVLYHHSQHAPLDRTVKVKYLAAFLYRGYLILARVKRNKFEVRHYLPLEVLEIIDIKEGFLPFSIRLAIRDHCFDLAATCEEEKELWTTELTAARQESLIPPFELPSSVPLFTSRSRHGSTNSTVDLQQRTPGKRHSTLKSETTPDNRLSTHSTDERQTKRATICESSDLTASPEQSPVEILEEWDYRQSQTSTVFLQRPSLTAKLQADRALSDVVSEALATARSKTQLQSPGADRRSLLLEPRLRRRRSIAEMRPVVDIIEKPEVRGAIINGDRPRSLIRTGSFVDNNKRESGEISHNSSFASISEMGSRLSRRMSTSRSTMEMASLSSRAEPATNRSRAQQRRAMSSSDLGPRARSVPPTPIKELVTSPFAAEVESAEAEDVEGESPAPQPEVGDSTDSVVYFPADNQSNTTRKPKSLRRSLSFFSRKTLSDADTDDSGTAPPISRSQSSGASKSSGGAATPPQVRTAPSTPVVSPQTPVRRRSIRLLGQLRGFTPI